MDGELIKQRAKLLQRYLKDDQKELQALYALQALMVQLEQPASKQLVVYQIFATISKVNSSVHATKRIRTKLLYCKGYCF